MVFIFVTLTIFELLQKAMVRSRKNNLEYCLETTDIAAALQAANRLADESSCELTGISAEHLSNGNYHLNFRVKFGRGNAKRRKSLFFEGLAAEDAVISVGIQDEPAGVK